jgi:hypothetical protein
MWVQVRLLEVIIVNDDGMGKTVSLAAVSV